MPNGTGLSEEQLLIELRVRPGDFRFRSVLKAVAANRLVHHGKIAKVPHLSLYGNTYIPSKNLPELRRRVATVCSKYQTLPYLVDNYDSKLSGEEGNVIAFRIIPSPELLSFRRELVKALQRDFPSQKPWDQENKDFWFHITIGWKLSDSDLERVWEYLNRDHSKRNPTQEEPLHVRRVRPYLPLEALRVTMLGRGGRIDREYDLLQKKLLTRDKALDWHEGCKTYRAYRVKKEMELKGPSWFKQFTRKEKKLETYFISDLHLDHGNIIRYCARPFVGRDVSEMNRVLINNWNRTVGNTDKVYFLGDLTFGRDRKPSSYWWPRLKGEKYFVKGNHDDNSVAGISYDKISIWDEKEKETKYFAVVHEPNEMPDEIRKWVDTNNAWVIHGDKHNNNVRDYPFINGEKKTINVCVEVVDYKPVSLSFLLSLGINRIRRMDTIRSVPQLL
ncbi:MAG: 2'-5' RNA ligase family protein [Thaumarchaeota archaeon]|nr:2'-5' RNA ligase family protein [Nitrososphaerota archaeon]